MVRSVGALALASLVVMLAAVRPAHAHDEGVSSSEVELGARQIVWRLDVPVAALVHAGRLPGAARTDASSVRSARDAVGGYLASALTVEADGHRLAAELGPLEPGGAAPPLTRVVQTLTFKSPGPLRSCA